MAMYPTLTEEQQGLLEVVKDLTRERLAPRASRYDEESLYPTENWRDLWESGLLAMTVPRDFGGMGLDFLPYIMVLEEVARGCANTAMTLHMHSTVQRFVGELASDEQKATYYREVVEGGRPTGPVPVRRPMGFGRLAQQGSPGGESQVSVHPSGAGGNLKSHAGSRRPLRP